MVDYAIYTNQGGRKNNEDYVRCAKHGGAYCFILCDGLGGHEFGEVASMTVAESVAKRFEELGDSPDFLKEAFNAAQQELLDLQEQKDAKGAMKTTMVVLVVTESQIKWAHIGDSRLYHIYNDDSCFERTRDHSLVQLLADMGEIKEEEIRTSEDRNKVLRVMGNPWSGKSFDLSPILERDANHSFVLMTDGAWEYVYENEMLSLLASTESADSWLHAMEKKILERADMTKTDNYSIICVKTTV